MLFYSILFYSILFYPHPRTFFHCFLEMKGERNIDVREKHQWLPPAGAPTKDCTHPDGGSNPQTRNVPWPGIKPASLQVRDNAPSYWATLARTFLENMYMFIDFKRGVGRQGRKGERERETWIGLLPPVLQLGMNPQPRCVLWQGIRPPTFWCTGTVLQPTEPHGLGPQLSVLIMTQALWGAPFKWGLRAGRAFPSSFAQGGFHQTWARADSFHPVAYTAFFHPANQ